MELSVKKYKGKSGILCSCLKGRLFFGGTIFFQFFLFSQNQTYFLLKKEEKVNGFGREYKIVRSGG